MKTQLEFILDCLTTVQSEIISDLEGELSLKSGGALDRLFDSRRMKPRDIVGEWRKEFLETLSKRLGEAQYDVEDFDVFVLRLEEYILRNQFLLDSHIVENILSAIDSVTFAEALRVSEEEGEEMVEIDRIAVLERRAKWTRASREDSYSYPGWNTI